MRKYGKTGQSPRTQRVTETHQEATPTDFLQPSAALRATFYRDSKAIVGRAVARGGTPQQSTGTICSYTTEFATLLWTIGEWEGFPVRSRSIAMVLTWIDWIRNRIGDGTLRAEEGLGLMNFLLESVKITMLEVEARRRLEENKLNILEKHGGYSRLVWTSRRQRILRTIRQWSDTQLCDITRHTAGNLITPMYQAFEAGEIL